MGSLGPGVLATPLFGHLSLASHSPSQLTLLVAFHSKEANQRESGCAEPSIPPWPRLEIKGKFRLKP